MYGRPAIDVYQQVRDEYACGLISYSEFHDICEVLFG
jgi:hypothetical protein